MSLRWGAGWAALSCLMVITGHMMTPVTVLGPGAVVVSFGVLLPRVPCVCRVCAACGALLLRLMLA
jgi:hypothetical protein